MEQLDKMRAYFESGATQNYDFRIGQLLKLKATIIKYEQQIFNALQADLGKSKEECYISENGFVLSEISHTIKKLKKWMRAETVGTNLLNFPSKSYIINEPLGVVLIISPWNYPFNLLLTPLVGAIAAGNCVVLKPSELAPATEHIMQTIIEEAFNINYVQYVKGDGAKVVPELMNSFVFDHVLYTGSTAVGKIIYELAAKNLVPVTLELGGKSPCIVAADADIKTTAKRIAMAKFNNAGQMCVAPDYVLVHKSKVDELIDAMKKTIVEFFGEDAQNSNAYGRIINNKQFDRLAAYLDNGSIVFGGKIDKANLYITPTLLSLANTNEPIMEAEIFGPILPIISYGSNTEALTVIKKHKNPLAFYLFTGSKTEEKYWLQAVPAGGGCINNVALHLTNHKLPFGGRGASGTGSYHGKHSFDTFSHKKSILKSPTWFDPSAKYPPYTGKLNLFKMIMK